MTGPRTDIASLHEDLARVRRYLTPSTAAEIQERLWEFTARLEELAERLAPPPVPVVSRPRRLPRPLNPFYFTRRRKVGDAL